VVGEVDKILSRKIEEEGLEGAAKDADAKGLVSISMQAGAEPVEELSGSQG